jgi:hypothetical protein
MGHASELRREFVVPSLKGRASGEAAVEPVGVQSRYGGFLSGFPKWLDVVRSRVATCFM